MYTCTIKAFTITINHWDFRFFEDFQTDFSTKALLGNEIPHFAVDDIQWHPLNHY